MNCQDFALKIGTILQENQLIEVVPVIPISEATSGDESDYQPAYNMSSNLHSVIEKQLPEMVQATPLTPEPGNTNS